MKVAHFSLWAPHRSGLFEFVVDQMKYEKKAGLEPLFIHTGQRNPDPNRFKHEAITCSTWEEAKEAEVWVLHRSIPNELLHMVPKKKSIAVLHGTSEIMALHEIESNGVKDKFNMHIGFMDTFQKIVTITKSDTQIMQQYDNGRKKVVYINDAVDMEKYSLDGHSWNYLYRPAIITTSNVRINKNPAPLFWSMPDIIKRIPRARLNVFGINLASILTWKNIVLKSGDIGIAVENFHGQFNDLRPFMRGADISFNSNYNGIFSRDSMESMAMGLSVVAYTPEHTPYACYRHAPSIVDAVEKAWNDLKEDPEKQMEKNREYAETHFNMEKAVQQYIDLYNSI